LQFSVTVWNEANSITVIAISSERCSIFYKGNQPEIGKGYKLNCRSQRNVSFVNFGQII
jgi:hypothetical protein